MDLHGGRGAEPGAAFVDLHCHTSASFDSLADPLAVVRAARSRGITHLAITDHDRIDGAVRARDAALPGITVIVGEEVRTTEGDLVCIFLEEAIPPGLPAAEVIARARAQGALVGIPHPFDHWRGSVGKAEERIAALAGLVDWVEAHNARVVLREANERAAELARRWGVPGIAVSDAHTALEVGVAATRLVGDPSTPGGLLAALATASVVPGRASLYVRAVTPLAKLVQRVRGNGRVRPGARPDPGVASGRRAP
ncbi:MAG: PHP domain-containing protein [Chloroflexi bacterium]|nr:PHP domain-containing protein [Chloroflexota bacterium]